MDLMDSWQANSCLFKSLNPTLRSVTCAGRQSCSVALRSCSSAGAEFNFSTVRTGIPKSLDIDRPTGPVDCSKSLNRSRTDGDWLPSRLVACAICICTITYPKRFSPGLPARLCEVLVSVVSLWTILDTLSSEFSHFSQILAEMAFFVRRYVSGGSITSLLSNFGTFEESLVRK